MLIYLQMIETEEDSSKFETIYFTYRDLMFYVAYKQMQNEQDAEDVVHDVFVKVAENIQKIDPVSQRTKQLVITMINNRVTDVFRVRGRHPVTELKEELFADQAEEMQEENLLMDCIMELPDRQRNVIWLKYGLGYSLREIANLLDISLVSAQKIDQRAKRKLELLYEKRGGIL